MGFLTEIMIFFGVRVPVISALAGPHFFSHPAHFAGLSSWLLLFLRFGSANVDAFGFPVVAVASG